MSWMNRPQAGEGAAAAPQPYAAPQGQPFPNQQNMYPNYPSGTGGAPPPQQAPPYWAGGSAPQQPPQHYNQQYAQVYQQEYPPNANQQYQQAQYNHNYTQPQQNYYQNQPPQSYPPNQPVNSDGWEDNWDWGWEESAKQAQKAQNAGQPLPVQQEQIFNNANVLDESFVPTNTWNWAMDDKKGSQEPAVLPPQLETTEPPAPPLHTIENNMTSELTNICNLNNGAPVPSEEVRTLGDKEVIKERMPNLALGKRFHLENLTPQWSIESQMSQESSDGPQTHTESTYRSENQSRNSNSPGPNTDNSNYTYSQSGLDEGYTQSRELPTQSDLHTPLVSGTKSHEELAQTMQDLSLVNHENPSFENQQINPEIERRNSQQNMVVMSTSPQSTGALPQPVGPPPAMLSMTPPSPVPSPARPPSAVALSALPPAVQPPPASLPPPNFPPPSNSQNPFKHVGPLAHASKMSSLPGQGYSAQSAHLASPAIVGKATRTPAPGFELGTIDFEANLETTPDNSERPDHPPPAGGPCGPPAPAPAPSPRSVPDNMEVAPQNDRNEYLQTAHLSTNEYGENAEFARDEPPPGLRRMVLGRQEEYGRGADEPPPGLARMVPGRQTEGDGACDRPPEPYRSTERYRRADGEYRNAGAWRPPPNEHRVVPGFERAGAERSPDLDGSAWPPPAPADNLQEPSGAPTGEPSYSLEAGSPAAGERAPPSPARRSSADTDRERAGYDGEGRRERRDSRDRDRDGDGRHSRPNRHERDDRKPTRDDRRSERRDRRDRDRRDRDESPDARRKRRSARAHRYETEDTDCYSDRERDRRRHREGSYASRPPRPDEERGSRARRHGAEGRDRRERDRHERSYRDIDPERKHGNRRRERDEERRRGDTYSSPSRAESREATATDEEPERRRDRRHRHSSRRTQDPYYDGYGDPYLAQRQQYSYYERLRATDPAAYMQLYKRLMAARTHPHALLDGYVGAEALYGGGARDERGSVHSGRSSAHAHRGNDTDLTTEVSLPTNLETSTVRSERMTPHRFSTAHVKGSISSRDLVVVRPSWPVDGLPATVRLVSLARLLQHEPAAAELHHCPAPLVKGVTHKKSVVEYCVVRARSAAREGAPDPRGYKLLWDLLALLLSQNGVVVGSDIAELLMKNTREHPHQPSAPPRRQPGSRRGSSGSESASGSSPDYTEHSAPEHASNECSATSASASVDESTALERFRELLLYGNKQEALEWAMSCKLWGHALQLASGCGRRTRGAVAARFLSAVPRDDPLHTLYAALGAARPPPLQPGGDWRPHVAIILANGGAQPEQDTRTLTMFGDSLAARGLVYCAQFCYVAGGVPFGRHPLAPLSPPPAPTAPPRLCLLAADPGARSLSALATTRAILATEIYEYALSLNRDYCIPELQVYKFVLACRLVDCGLYERALSYVEQAARAVTREPRLYSPLLVKNLADMADRLKYHDPALHEEPPLVDEADSEGSPRHQQWLADVQHVAHMLQAESAQPPPPAVDEYSQHQLHYSWEQAHQYQQQQLQQPSQLTPPAPPRAEGEEPDYSHQYYAPPPPPAAAPPPTDVPLAPAPAPAPEPDVTSPQYAYDDWNRTEVHHAQTYGDSYWHGDNTYSYGEGQQSVGEAGAEESNPRPMITMPGAHKPPAHSYGDDNEHDDNQGERDTDTPKSSRQQQEARGGGKEGAKGEGGGKGGGWLGGILTKLSLRAPNQMILPDDKNPTIVWDPDKKRWKNLDGEETEGEQPPPPPPRTADLAPSLLLQNTSTPKQSPAGAPPPASAPVSNIFKMQKGRHIKKSYVDVFNPGGGGGGGAPPPAPAALAPPPAPPLAHNPTYFVPSPQINDYELKPEERIHSGI